MTVVLDSWAVLRLLEGRSPAADAVSTLIAGDRPIMSWINLGEVFYVVRRATNDAEAQTTVRDLCDVLTAELPDVARVLAAGRIKTTYPLAYADAFAAATALAHSAQLWTGDPELLLKARRGNGGTCADRMTGPAHASARHTGADPPEEILCRPPPA